MNVTTNEKQSRCKSVIITAEGKQILGKITNAAIDMEEFPFDLSHLSEEDVTKFLELGQSILDVHKGVYFKNKVIDALVEA
ncbi:hypothetical protein ACJ2A9_02625 [Anaerobacillus sp. MEB173]|uniref:hypothetical protein n=1 Tax=Anaerobacillus sp. MEB173 TaxID=3383345 RepID=UPI003F8D9675